MATLIIEIPDYQVNGISSLIKEKGGTVVNANAGEENLTPVELELLKRGLKEALLIKEGKLKSIPFSELWND